MHAKAIPRGLRGWVCVLFLAASSALAGMPPDHAYREMGFAPITDEQVRGIIEEAQRVPSNLCETEDA